jgi:hypothetical protein
MSEIIDSSKTSLNFCIDMCQYCCFKRQGLQVCVRLSSCAQPVY